MTEVANVRFGPGLEGVVHRPGQAGRKEAGAVILLHGAGSGMDSPLIVKTAVAAAELGFMVLRFNFSYLGRRPAPSQGGKREQPELVEAIDFMKSYGPPILIGKSFGARVASHVAAGHDGISGLVFYGLPLQGMSAGSRPRDWSHLCTIKAPTLFITGDKDKLCPLEHLRDVQKLITVACKSEVVPGDHSFKPKGEDRAVQSCIDWLKQQYRV